MSKEELNPRIWKVIDGYGYTVNEQADMLGDLIESEVRSAVAGVLGEVEETIEKDFGWPQRDGILLNLTPSQWKGIFRKLVLGPKLAEIRERYGIKKDQGN